MSPSDRKPNKSTITQKVIRSCFRYYFDTFHGVEVKGLDNYYAATDKTVIVSNHLSFADACLIACYLPDSPTFVVNTQVAGKWWARPFLSAVDIFKVDIQSSYSVKHMTEAVRDQNRKLMIFPEGRLTKTGSLMKVYEGAGVVADKAGAKVLPISIEGLQFTPLGRMKGKLPIKWFPKLAVNIMPSVFLSESIPNGLMPRKRREAVGKALQEVMVDTVYRAKNTNRTLFSALLDAKDQYGADLLIAEDVNREPITYGKLILASVALGRKISNNITKKNDSPTTAGLMLPNMNGTLISFMALEAFGMVPCMLPYTAGAETILSACQAANLNTVVTSRAFVEKGKLSKTVELLKDKIKFLWLEDLKESISLKDKIRAKFDVSNARNLPGAKADPGDWAVVLYTSGSEGTPKGVVHSHKSILSNCAQISSVVDFNGSDRVFNAMPIFHSFGLTAGTLLPLFYGVRTFLYPSPIHYRIVPSLIYDTDATICFGTDTFLNGWAKYAHPYDFYSMRYIFGGAEKIREETRRLYADRFGVRLLEGYGATETAPVIAMNTAMHCQPGTVGQILPGIKHRLEEVEGIVGGGQLYVKGPNLMLGYISASNPGVLEPCGEEYDTGDIVSINDEKHVKIIDRVKRFAKIAGEKISMNSAESLVIEVWPDYRHAVIAIDDARKGQALLLVTTNKDATVKEILERARERDIPEIMVPRQIVPVDTMPLLGTGKVDYKTVTKMINETLSH